MDDLDKQILDIMQHEIPLTSNPYDIIAKQINSSEKEVLNRVKKLKQEGIIRRIGGSFNSAGIGYYSVLVAGKVPADKLEQTVAIINQYTGVTHNYERINEYNLWFTLSASSKQRLDELLEEIKQKTGIENLVPLPSLEKFKIKVYFKMAEGK